MLIRLKKYCEDNNIKCTSLYNKISKGQVKSAVKKGKFLYIDDSEKIKDERTTSGKYKNWRKMNDAKYFETNTEGRYLYTIYNETLSKARNTSNKDNTEGLIEITILKGGKYVGNYNGFRYFTV